MEDGTKNFHNSKISLKTLVLNNNESLDICTKNLNKKFNCSLCNNIYSSSISLNYHKKKKHPENTSFKQNFSIIAYENNMIALSTECKIDKNDIFKSNYNKNNNHDSNLFENKNSNISNNIICKTKHDIYYDYKILKDKTNILDNNIFIDSKFVNISYFIN